MPKSDLYVGGWTVRSEVSLEVDRIRGEGGPEYPRLVIPIEIALRRAEHGEQFKACSLLWLQSSLHIENIKIAEGFSGPITEYSWPQVTACQIHMELPLDLYRLEKIEERRAGDIQFRLSGSGLLAAHPLVPKAPPSERQEYRRDVEEFIKGHFDITFSVPQSHWVDKILPGLGYGKVILVEIPIPEKIIPDTFKDSREELVQAQAYLVQGDYDKAVAHCRNALEPLKKLLPRVKVG